MARYLKTLVGNVPGVQQRLISVQQEGDQFVIIVGGGDSYQVASAIWQADFYTPGLSGATIKIAGVSNTNPVVITTANNHNLQTGDLEIIADVVGMPFLNNQVLPITVLDAQRFSVPLDATIWGRYQYGGTVAPNPINLYVTITDYPDSFLIPYVNPPQELVDITVTWITISPNFVSPVAMAQAAVPAIVDYINSLPAGTSPINFNVLNQVFLQAVAGVLQPEYIVNLLFQVSIGGVGTSPAPGTNVIFGDPFSYFYTENGRVTVIEG
jgi:hypothetical protein